MPLGSTYLDAVKGFEGFTPTAQWDYKQNSNGYGTKALFPGETIDRPTAETRFTTEMTNAAAHVDKAFPNLPEGKRAALTSLTYNAGPGWINAGLGDAVRNGDWNDAAARFTQYTKAGGKHNEGLASRRAQEVSWFDPMPGAVTSSAPMTTAFQQAAPTPAASQQGKPTMAETEQPGMWQKFIAGGPGALFGAPNGQFQKPDGTAGYDLKHSLQGAAGWAQSLDNPAALTAALQQRDDYNLVSGADGTMYRVNKKTGKVANVSGPKTEIVTIGNGPLGEIKGIKRGDNIFTMDGNHVAGPGVGVPGAPPGAPGVVPAGAAPGGAAVGGLSDLGLGPVLKTGLKTYDDNVTGRARLDQFKPEYREQIISYLNGNDVPVGKGDKYTQWIKAQAKRVGAEEGLDVSDQAFFAKRTMLTDLAKSNPASAGGQAILGRTALDHLGHVADGFKGIKNQGLEGIPLIGSIPGSGAVSHAWNSFWNSSASNSKALKALEDAAIRQAEESSKYYAGSQAAQAERERVHKLYATDMQPQEAVALLKSERGLMADKIEQAIGQMATTLGPSHPKVLEQRALFDKTLAKVDAKIASMTATDPAASTRKPLTDFAPAAGPSKERRPIGSFNSEPPPINPNVL